MRKPIKIELTLLNVYIVIHGLTLLWIFLIRLVLQISIPVSFEVLKPSLNQISHSIHWSIFWVDYHDFSAVGYESNDRAAPGGAAAPKIAAPEIYFSLLEA